MTDGIYSWIQNVACFFVLLSAVMNCLPDNSYKKYVQFYMGLLLILVILSPVFQFTGLENEIYSFFREFQALETEKEEWQERAGKWEETWNAEGEEEILKGQEVSP